MPELYRTDYPDNNVTDHALDTNTSAVTAPCLTTLFGSSAGTCPLLMPC